MKDEFRAEQVDGHTIKRWRQTLKIIAESPKREKAAMHERRLRGAGGVPDLTEEEEKKIDDWIMDRRQRELRVQVIDIKKYATTHFKVCSDGSPFEAGDKWVSGFMKRRRFSMRLATTNKPVTTMAMRSTQFHQQCC